MISPMKTLLSLLLAFITFNAFAADAAPDPSGTWKWKASAMGHEIESTLQLTFKEGVLRGTIAMSGAKDGEPASSEWKATRP